MALLLWYANPGLAEAQSDAAGGKPNIIIVNIDDMGVGDLSVYGSQFSSTPRLDQLASEGTRFTQFYAGASICSPSRAALFTGQYSARSGVNSFLSGSADNLRRDNVDSLSLAAPSMAKTFQQGGYATGHFGKWHLGGGRDVGYAANPSPTTNVTAPRVEEYGYDQVWTQFEGLGNRIINVQDYGGDAGGVTIRPSNFSTGLNRQSDELGTDGGQDQIVYLEREYNANFMVDRAIDFLGASKHSDPNQPVFMNVWLDEVHTPHDPPAALRAKYNALYPNLPQTSRDYLAVLEATDTQIGRLIDYVDQQGLGDETMILVTADNGAEGQNVNNIGSSTAALRGSKGDLFEGGFREPLIARWTGSITANRVDSDTVMWQTDLFPTLTAIAGVPAPAGVAFDGENLSDALLGVSTQIRSTPLFWNTNRGTENRHDNPNPNGAGAGGQEVLALRSGDWKLLVNAQGSAPELYDLAIDPGETNNLALQQTGVVSQLASQALSIRYEAPARILPDSVNAIVRLKAEDLKSQGDGATVSTWIDSATGDSFNGSVSQAAAGARPTLRTDSLNGRAVVEFDGNDSLVSSAVNSLSSPAEGITVFAVATGDQSGSVAERLAQIGDSGGAPGQVVGLDLSESPKSTNNGGAGFRFNNGASLYDTPIAEEGFHIVAWQLAAGESYADARLFVDGTTAESVFTGESTNASGSAGFTGNDLELILGTGRAANGALLQDDLYTGSLAEFLVFNEQLSIGQMNLIGNYLSSEYGLPFAYRTNLDLFEVSGLSWTGGTGNFDASWNGGDGNGGLGVSNTNPFATGDADLYLGANGVVTLDAATTPLGGSRVNSLRVGTFRGGLVVSGAEGDGLLSVTNGRSLTIGTASPPSSSPDTGNLTVGEDGFSGTLVWNSTGTLAVEGQLRIGQGGEGTFEQTAGTVLAGHVGGSLKFAAIGSGAGSQGTYLLRGGRFLPGGGVSGPQRRHLRVGFNGADGFLEVGDGQGPAGSASVESSDDLYVGYDGGEGVLRLRSDGLVLLQGNDAPVFIGLNNSSRGEVFQDGGSFESDGLFVLGEGAGASGLYDISGGTLVTAQDGAGTLSIGRAGGAGTMRVSGNAEVTHSGTIVLADGGTGTSGAIELLASTASFQTERLENLANGADEAIRWVADSAGVTPITIANSSGTNPVQLQNPAEAAANRGGNGNLSGDGTALGLDLAALASTQTLTLIDNQSAQSITGFFEDGVSSDLYEEGDLVESTGFVGSISISYVGGDGNDVVLNLLAGLVGDYNADGRVDAADYVVWRDNLGGSPDAIQNRRIDTIDDLVGELDYQAWRANYGQTISSAATLEGNSVPEPTTTWLALFAILIRATERAR